MATPLNNLAQLLQATNRLAEAEPLMKRALAIDEKALGPEHPNVAAALNIMAVLCLQEGEYAKAEPLLLRSVAVNEKVLGPEHADVAPVHRSIGNTLSTDVQCCDGAHHRSLA